MTEASRGKGSIPQEGEVGSLAKEGTVPSKGDSGVPSFQVLAPYISRFSQKPPIKVTPWIESSLFENKQKTKNKKTLPGCLGQHPVANACWVLYGFMVEGGRLKTGAAVGVGTLSGRCDAAVAVRSIQPAFKGFKKHFVSISWQNSAQIGMKPFP